MSKVIFKSRKETSEFLKEKGIDTSNWTEKKWQSINKSQAEIHMQALAEAMYDEYNESTPKELKEGEYHIPFGDRMQDKDIMQHVKGSFNSRTEVEEAIQKFKIKIATARCARLSYMTFDGEIDYEKDLKLHDTLLESQHMSPFEHCARAMTKDEVSRYVKGYNFSAVYTEEDIDEDTLEPIYCYTDAFGNSSHGWCNNFRGWISYRYLIENNLI